MLLSTKMCVLIFSTAFVGNIFNSKKNRARYDKKWILVFEQSTWYSRQVLTLYLLTWRIW